MSHPKGTRQEAPPQVKRNSEYQPNTRRTFSSLTQLQGNPASHAANPENTDFLLHFETNSESPPTMLEETPSFQQQLERNPEFLLQLKRPNSPAVTLEETQVPHLN